MERLNQITKNKIKENLKLIENYLVYEYADINSSMFIKLNDSLTLKIYCVDTQKISMDEIYKNIKLVDKFGSEYGFNSKYGSTIYNDNALQYSMELILQWDFIKNSIMEQQKQDIEKINKIFNFEI